ncbi:uncharacterized protein LOC134562370 [Prinia subflava]|uniref:uncharacterized protein LOC134562370 n=1 Tax=Prinia subflava TaxID=208062 RepID=UPI002FDF8844
MLMFHWEGPGLPPALVPPGLQLPPRRDTGTRVLCPGLRCHIRVSAALQASQETLHCAAGFLKRRNLKQLLKKEQLQIDECLLAEDRSRAAEHLRRVLPYLQNPENPLRAAAIRFLGRVWRRRRGQQEELQVLRDGLQGPRKSASPSRSNIEIQAQLALRAEAVGFSSGSSESLSQEQNPETLKRTPPPSAAGSSDTADDWHS